MQNYYNIIKTSLGFCAIVFKIDPFLLKKIFLPLESKKSFEIYKKNNELSKILKHEKADFISNKIKNYFSKGKKIEFSLDLLDFNGTPEFSKKVLYSICDIPFGETKSYKEVAESIKNPRAARAVGNALAKNPFPIIVPCHRVIKSDGSPGKFGGGVDMKIKMLTIEGYYRS
jgi:methylated-DNA-[protein]-cysteine S-methyltransferase